MVNSGKQRGELRIYLGAAPGAGKTYAMLGEAHRRSERGTDVVVALVETHGREQTRRLLHGLEEVPRRRAVHRGVDVTDMDLDAVLARAPDVAVVDELAHTNAPGSRNTKRWQDIDELLDAGITVLSTVNVQHLESLNDVVEAITGIRQRETVPDEVVRSAEQVELADITPEALRRRLAHGNVYAADRVDAALGNYFRTGNLTALRELALLWLADQVDVALRRYRRERHITATWEARERVVVAITGGPESETLIRRARRIAARAGADLQVVHVLRGDGLAGASPAGLAGARRVADDVGASFHSVVGDDVPEALLEFARGADATQLVLGTSRRSRWARVLDEGIGSTVVQRSGSIDVHMVTHAHSGHGRARRAARNPLSFLRRAWGWALAFLLPALITALSALLGDFELSVDVVGYFLATVVVALVGGVAPALTAALFAGGLLNFFFAEPRYSLAVSRPEVLVTVLGMIGAGLMVAVVVDRAARLAERAARARTEAALLASYARTPRSRTPIRCRACWRSWWRTSACPPRHCWNGRMAGTWPPPPAPRRTRGPKSPMWTSRSPGTRISCCTSRAAARCPPRTARCWKPPRAKRSSRCASSGWPPRRRKPSARPTPASCAPRCCRPWATTCAPRSRRSRLR